jgi:hypothetical protein
MKQLGASTRVLCGKIPHGNRRERIHRGFDAWSGQLRMAKIFACRQNLSNFEPFAKSFFK